MTPDDQEPDVDDFVAAICQLMQQGKVPYLEAQSIVRAMMAEYWSATRLLIEKSPSKLVH